MSIYSRMKKLTWLGDSRVNVKSFPGDVQDDIGYALYVAQLGEMSSKAKPLHGLGGGVMEIAAEEASGEALEQKPSSGNVSIKAGLVVRIGRSIRQRKLTQADAAQLMGIDQPKVSAMLAGQFRGYSVERLMRFLVALGHDVEIAVKPGKRGTAELRVA